MKRKIRRDVFETNSSSVHTLSISKTGMEKCRLKQDKDGMLNVALGNFGKESELYENQKDKLSYLMTQCYYVCKMDLDTLYESYIFEYIEEYIKEYTGCNGIKIKYPGDAYIDHQSVPDNEYDLIVDIFDKESVLDFVFNKYVKLKTGCD